MNSKISKFIKREQLKRLEELSQSDAFKQIQQRTHSESYRKALKVFQKTEIRIHEDTLSQIAKYQAEVIAKVSM